MLFVETNKIDAVHAAPQVAISGVTTKVTLSASVVNDSGAPVSGTTITWLNTLTQVTDTSDTDTSGLAILDVDLSSLPPGFEVIPYIAYMDSDISTGQYINVRIANPGINMPQINDGGDFNIDQYNIASGVTVTIPAYPNASRGDLVNFYWDELHSTGLSVVDPDTDFPWVIDVNKMMPPECLVNGNYALYYQFKDSNGNFGVSLPRNESVTGSQPAPSLPAADFPEADANGGWINSILAVNGTPAHMLWDTIADGDVVNLTWTLYDQDGVQLLIDDKLTTTVQDASKGLVEIIVPSDDIPQGVQLGSAQAWYTVTPANGGDLQASAVANVKIDTQA